ncbi:MAG: hypothetical protein ACO1TE_14680 [Prosthecobacter sp.]
MNLINQGKASYLIQINDKRTELYMSYRAFKDMNGEDNYESAIESIVNQVGDDGVTTADLNAVFPEGTLLGEARVKLHAEKKIEVAKEKTTWRLRPIGAAERIAEAEKQKA